MDILVDMPKVAGHVHPQAPLDRKIVPAGSLSVVEAVFQMLTDRSTRGAIGLNNGIHDVGVNLTRNLLSRDGHLIAGKAHQTLQQTAICAVVKDTEIGRASCRERVCQYV